MVGNQKLFTSFLLYAMHPFHVGRICIRMNQVFRVVKSNQITEFVGHDLISYIYLIYVGGFRVWSPPATDPDVSLHEA